MIYPAVHTEIEPPGLGDEEPGEPQLAVAGFLGEIDETRRAGYSALSPDADDDTIADAMVRCMEGAALMRSPGLLAALQRRMRA